MKQEFGGSMFPVFFVEVVAVGKGVDVVRKMGNHKEFVRAFDSPLS